MWWRRWWWFCRRITHNNKPQRVGGGGGGDGGGGGGGGGVGGGGGGGGGGFENSYVALYCRNQYLSSLHFLATHPTDHGVCFCSTPKSKLRVGITSRYLTGILITYGNNILTFYESYACTLGFTTWVKITS
jgi:hypothetical protein